MKPAPRLRLSRPLTARAVARRAGSLREFGLNLRDWLHEVHRMSSRARLRAAVQTRPPRLAGRFEQGEIADAFLAAQVEWLCHRAGIPPPRWTRDPACVLDRPWFSLSARSLRTHLLLETPVEFRNRNLFTIPEGGARIRRGRPVTSDEVKREKARLRQRRHRERLQAGVGEASGVRRRRRGVDAGPVTGEARRGGRVARR